MQINKVVDIDGPKPHKSIGLGAIDGPKPYKCIRHRMPSRCQPTRTCELAGLSPTRETVPTNPATPRWMSPNHINSQGLGLSMSPNHLNLYGFVTSIAPHPMNYMVAAMIRPIYGQAWEVVGFLEVCLSICLPVGRSGLRLGLL